VGIDPEGQTSPSRRWSVATYGDMSEILGTRAVQAGISLETASLILFLLVEELVEQLLYLHAA
jgi:hypothetical protein